MKITKQHLVFFSATGNTRKLIRNVAKAIDLPAEEYNITNEMKENSISLSSSDLLVIAVPSYSGRVPAICVSSINKFKGDNTSAIIMCSYGNRDYDDTLLELKNIITQNGFKVVSAAAFVASHSIFPHVGADRPNAEDELEQTSFARHSLNLLNEMDSSTILLDIQVKGNFPYREASHIPLRPKGNKNCDSCGTCVQLCPSNAISEDSPRKTDKNKCVSCARCIASCPQQSRAFGGLLYKIASKSFGRKYTTPQSNVMSYVE